MDIKLAQFMVDTLVDSCCFFEVATNMDPASQKATYTLEVPVGTTWLASVAKSVETLEKHFPSVRGIGNINKLVVDAYFERVINAGKLKLLEKFEEKYGLQNDNHIPLNEVISLMHAKNVEKAKEILGIKSQTEA